MDAQAVELLDLIRESLDYDVRTMDTPYPSGMPDSGWVSHASSKGVAQRVKAMGKEKGVDVSSLLKKVIKIGKLRQAAEKANEMADSLAKEAAKEARALEMIK